MRLLTSLGAVLVTAVAANAIPLNYQIGTGSSVAANTADPGLAVDTSILSSFANTAFTLNDGESFTVDFFKIWAIESSVSGDDTDPMPISATIDFAIPDENGIVTGVTFGAQLNFVADAGYLTWDGPSVLALGDRTFTIELEDVEFSKGHILDWDLSNKKATVSATFTQNSSKVPDGGATAALLGLGVAGLALVRRSRS